MDFKKAYDSVLWDFLEHMITQVGFGMKMKLWLMWCVKNVSISIVVNDSPTTPLNLQKDLR